MSNFAAEFNILSAMIKMKIFLMLTMLALTAKAQQKVYTLADCNIKDWDAA